MRLAWLSPWPPQPSGIAGRSAEVVPLLAARGFGIDVFVDERAVPTTKASSDPPDPGDVRVQSAHDFLWRDLRGQYDLAVYQLGNSQLHQFMWPYLLRRPGLVVLHDARLHHARGRALLSEKRAAAYRAEFAWNQPTVSPDAAELAVAGFSGAYYYQWPLVRTVVESSRLVACHARGGVALLAADFPSRPLDYIALGEGRAAAPDLPERANARDSLGLPPESVVFGIFGGLTAEKRVESVIRAFARARAHQPNARLLLAGARSPSADVTALSAAAGVTDAVICRHDLSDEAFDQAIAAVDVSLNLRWPSAVECSGPWLRALSASRPTVVVDLAHQTHVPALDPRTWRPYSGTPDGVEPVAIAIDIVDEDHSLGIAMTRLAWDTSLRETLGRAGRTYWEQHHTVPHMVDDYVRVIERACREIAPPRSVLPAGILADPWAHTRGILDPFGTEVLCALP